MNSIPDPYATTLQLIQLLQKRNIQKERCPNPPLTRTHSDTHTYTCKDTSRQVRMSSKEGSARTSFHCMNI